MKKNILNFIGLLVVFVGFALLFSHFSILKALLGFLIIILGCVLLAVLQLIKSDKDIDINDKNLNRKIEKNDRPTSNSNNYDNKQNGQLNHSFNNSNKTQNDLLYQKATVNNSYAHKPTPVNNAVHLPISADDLDFNNTIEKYLTTGHSSCPSSYDYNKYLRAEFDCILNNINKENIALSDYNLYRQSASLFYFEKSNLVNKNSNIKFLKDFIAIDLETTGLKTAYNDIIEITAIKFKDFKPISNFSTLLKPRKPITNEITKITGITNEMLNDKPKFSEIYEAFMTFIGSLPLVVHNANFDLKFLYVSGCQIDFNRRKIYDTLELSRKYIKDFHGEKLDSYKLADVCEEVSIYFNGSHRSSTDALAAGLLFNEIVKIRKDTENLLSLL